MQWGPWAQAVGNSDKVEALRVLGHLPVSEIAIARLVVFGIALRTGDFVHTRFLLLLY